MGMPMLQYHEPHKYGATHEVHRTGRASLTVTPVFCLFSYLLQLSPVQAFLQSEATER